MPSPSGPLLMGLAGVLSLCPAAATGQTATSQAPPPAWSAGVACDPAQDRIVVFGGYFRGLVSGTWERDGRGWRRATGVEPSPRNAPAMVHDAARAQILLFGGDQGQAGALGDTWVYDSSGWRELAVSGPPARSIHRMVYDSRRDRVVLFGGIAGGETLGDTWEWDGSKWLPMAAVGPPPRALHGMAYDPVRGVTVVFGGQTRRAADAPSLADTWEWDGSQWVQRTVAPAGPRDHITMAFDPGGRAVMLFGVAPGDTGPGEAWVYQGGPWRPLSQTGPRRAGGSLCAAGTEGAMLLYGGGDGAPTNELWRWSAGRWTLTP